MSKLTKTMIEAEQPKERPHYLWDSTQPGFGVKILPSGTKRYIVKYRTKGGGRSAQQRWYQVGTHGSITLDKAREIATKVLGAVADGKDPQEQKQAFRAAQSMNDLWDRFEKEHLSRRKPATVKHYKQIWSSHIKAAVGAKKVVDVNRDDIYRLHRGLSKAPYQANRALAVLSKMFNLAERWEMRPDGSNPCRHVEKYREDARERFLTGDELKRLGKSLSVGLASHSESPQMIGAIKLLLFTGARVSEILMAKWDWVDWENRVLKLPDSKTGAKPIYLSEPAIEVLKSLQELPIASENPYIVAGLKKGQPLDNLRKPWYRIRERAELGDVRLHDLRHTFASIGVSSGLSLPMIGHMLGHSQAQTTARYAHLYTDPVMNAVDGVGKLISGAVDS